ncbi:MAG: hypothetical protein GY906_20615 [bacterium]|nr:hypothetical protein [bacterium]
MDTVNLISVCAVAFVAVFVLLSFLAIVMQLITTLFPARQSVLDSAVIAAISTTVAGVIPGARVTQIEEES